LPTTEKVSVVVNEISTAAGEIEVITLSSDDESPPTALNPQPGHSCPRPLIQHRRISLTSTSSSSSTTLIDQPAAKNSLKQFKCAKCLYKSSFQSNIIKHLKAKHGKKLANTKYVEKLDKGDTTRTLAANEHDNLNTVEQAASASLDKILQNNNELHLNQEKQLPTPPPTPSQLPRIHNSSSSIPHSAVGQPLSSNNDISSNYFIQIYYLYN
jgi:hypothetical protein